ncbi:hypothetical protein STEG23_029712, partial [Scotinomys teguina]
MALMAGTVRRHSAVLEGEVSQTPRAAILDSSSALKVSWTPGNFLIFRDLELLQQEGPFVKSTLSDTRICVIPHPLAYNTFFHPFTIRSHFSYPSIIISHTPSDSKQESAINELVKNVIT